MLRRFIGPKKTTDLQKLDPTKIPQHVAMIMDGNGRWATRRGLPRTAGHQQGVKTLKEICYACGELGVKILTIYAFSTENWQRPETEVSFLLNLFKTAMREELSEIGERNVRVQIIGRKEGINPDLLAEMENLEEKTRNNDRMTLNVCFNYGGRAELVDAVKEMITQGLKPEEINEELISEHLYTRGMSDVDLMIRTSGEQRLSNFLPYQSVYAEIYFASVYWPDFSKKELYAAIWEYQNRERRFGRIAKR